MLVNLKEILKIAEEDKSAIGMFNATGFDSLQAVIGAAEELNKPVCWVQRFALAQWLHR